MKYRTDLILGEAFCLFIFFYFLDSGLSVLNDLQFYFWLRDSENREYGHPVLTFDKRQICEEILKELPFNVIKNYWVYFLLMVL